MFAEMQIIQEATIDMIFGEWNWNTAKEEWRKEAKEAGIKLGIEKTFNLIEKGRS